MPLEALGVMTAGLDPVELEVVIVLADLVAIEDLVVVVAVVAPVLALAFAFAIEYLEVAAIALGLTANVAFVMAQDFEHQRETFPSTYYYYPMVYPTNSKVQALWVHSKVHWG